MCGGLDIVHPFEFRQTTFPGLGLFASPGVKGTDDTAGVVC